MVIFALELLAESVYLIKRIRFTAAFADKGKWEKLRLN
jgi:hypothetical protein